MSASNRRLIWPELLYLTWGRGGTGGEGRGDQSAPQPLTTTTFIHQPCSPNHPGPHPSFSQPLTTPTRYPYP